MIRKREDFFRVYDTEEKVNEFTETCMEMHKDVFGSRGRHMTSWSLEQLVDWIMTFYVFNEHTECWDFKDYVSEGM